MNYPSKIDDWKTFEKNYLIIALNIFYIKKKCPVYISKINWDYEKQIVLLMIPNKKRRLALSSSKKVSTLLRGITSKHHDYFSCLNYVQFLGTEDKRKSHEKVSKTKDFCGIVIPSEKDNISEFDQNMKSH